ncbi:MAG TPA: TolC family protein [Rhodothermales bacterium]|nr:TolC family protein [Rhodothermales bacterium]
MFPSLTQMVNPKRQAMRGAGRVALLLALGVPTVEAQVPGDSLRLGDLLGRVEAQDPRARQRALQADLSWLRLGDVCAQWRPQVTFGAEAVAQSEVPEINVPVPGVEIPSPPHLRLQATADAQQLLYDGGRTRAQTALEMARRAEAEAGVGVALFPLRLAVVEAFYTARLADAQAALLRLHAADLDARRTLARSRAADGAALRADGAALDAEWLRAGQRIAEAEAGRRAALAVLADLTGQPLPPNTPLARADDALFNVDTTLAARPELALFEARRARAGKEADVAAHATRPQISAIGQLGLGRPGLAMFEDRMHPYGFVGLRARWNPLDWGTVQRAREAARLQQDLVETEREAFERAIRRDVEDERATLERLEQALADDSAIVAARTEVARVARRQFEEGTLLAADYAQRLNALYDALATRALHETQRSHARARLLVTLGQL